MSTQEFIKLFNLPAGSYRQVIPFDEGPAIGFSVVKEYPSNSSFVPVVARDGRNDSVILIRIAYYPDKVAENKVTLFADVNKASQYQFTHHFYNFDDLEGPSRDAVIASEQSKQPSSFDAHGRFIFDIATKKILDVEQRKEISGLELVEYLYDIHLKSITYLPFRSKLLIKKFGFSLPDKIIPYLQKILYGLGWEFYKDRDDFGAGILKPYIFKVNLRRKEDDKINVLGVPVPKVAAIISATIIFCLIVLDYYWGIDLLYLTAFIENKVDNNQIFIFAFVVVMVYAIDSLLPRFLFALINLTVRIRIKSSTPTRID